MKATKKEHDRSDNPFSNAGTISMFDQIISDFEDRNFFFHDKEPLFPNKFQLNGSLKFN